MGEIPHRRLPMQNSQASQEKRQHNLDQRTIKERQRIIMSWLITILIYAGIILFSVLLNWQFTVEAGDKSGPLAVKIGNPDALDLPDVKPEPPADAPVPPDTVADIPPSAMPDQEVPQASPQPTTLASPQASSRPTTKPSSKPTIKPQKTTAPRPKVTPQVSASPSAQNNIKPLLTAPPTAAVVEQKLPKGKDNGNSYETSFFNVKGFVGRNGGTPISQYMPLPRQVLGAIHDAVGHGKLTVPSATRQLEIFEKAYVQAGGNWQLRSENVPLAERDQLWAILEGAGYDLRKAEYKYHHLNPVVLEFVIGVPSGGKVAVKDIRIVQSSGDGSIDDAVVFGFRSVASFSNPTKEEVRGRYIYSFE